MRRFYHPFMYIVIFAIAFPLPAQALDGSEVARMVFDRDDGKDSYAKLKMLLVDKNDQKRLRTLVTAVKDYGKLTKSYTRFYTPASIDGTAFMTWENENGDNEQFLYLPALRRVRRVVSNQKKNSFVNTDFTYEDLERRKVELDAHQILNTESYEGRSCWVLESVPKAGSTSQYGKRVSWIARDLLMPLKIEFYDPKGKLVKRLLNSNLEKVDGIWTALDSEMQDLINNSRTLLRITEVKYNQGIPDRVFTQEYMMHGK